MVKTFIMYIGTGTIVLCYTMLLFLCFLMLFYSFFEDYFISIQFNSTWPYFYNAFFYIPYYYCTVLKHTKPYSIFFYFLVLFYVFHSCFLIDYVVLFYFLFTRTLSCILIQIYSPL